MAVPKNPFEYIAPTPKQTEDIQQFRNMCRILWDALNGYQMDPRCRALAITKLEEVSQWANKGIVFYEPPSPAHVMDSMQNAPPMSVWDAVKEVPGG